MSPETTGIVGIVVLLVCLLSRLPVAFAMAAVGITGFMYLSGTQAGLSILARDIFDQFASYPLSVIPMFIMGGAIPGWADNGRISCLCRLCSNMRLYGGNRRHHGQGSPSGDEKVWLF